MVVFVMSEFVYSTIGIYIDEKPRIPLHISDMWAVGDITIFVFIVFIFDIQVQNIIIFVVKIVQLFSKFESCLL